MLNGQLLNGQLLNGQWSMLNEFKVSLDTIVLLRP